MQERAATALVVFFLVILAGAGVMYVAAAPPDVTVDDPDFALSEGDDLTIDDRTYTITAVGDDDGSAEWIDEYVEFTDTWDHGSAVELDNVTYTVLIDANATPPTMTLEEYFELDDNVTVEEIDGEEYVVVTDNDEPQLIPRDEYVRQEFGEPERIEYTEGDQFDIDDTTVTLAEIRNESAVLTWTADVSEDVSFDHGALVMLGPDDTEFMAHIDGGQVYLTQDVEGYEDQLAAVDRFHERMEALFGIGLISAVSAGLILILAMNPVRRT